MRISLFLVFLSGFSLFAQDFVPPPNIAIPDTTHKIEFALLSHCYCGRPQYYIGGSAAISAFISKNISFPDEVNWGDVQYVRAYVRFIVEEDGSLTDIRVMRTNFPDINEHIVSVFRKMTNWVASEYGCSSERRLSYVRVPISLVLK
ncbi:MAG: hypothetical protein COA38_02020 [Fluviicola sp.]|nr:MAG: hypothetical protein COA38_02020 [Fluviicola sp.]